MFRPCLCLFVSGCVLSAQGSLSGPSLGFFFDSQKQAVRRISGIPGSAIVGRNEDLGFAAVQAAFSPDQSYALIVDSEGSVNLLSLAKLNAGKLGSGMIREATQALRNVPSTPDQIVFSPSGRSSALLYGTSIAVLTGLPGSAEGIGHVDLSALPRPPAAIAVSDDGSQVLVSIPGDLKTSESGGVYVFSGGSSTPRLIANAPAAGLTFLGASHDALIVDGSTNTVTALHDVSGSGSPLWTLSGEPFHGPTLARDSLDGREILLADPENGIIAVVNRDGTSPVFLSCTCSPSRIDPLTNSVYQVSDSLSGLMWILDLTQAPRLLFVPTPASDPGQPQ